MYEQDDRLQLVQRVMALEAQVTEHQDAQRQMRADIQYVKRCITMLEDEAHNVEEVLTRLPPALLALGDAIANLIDTLEP